MSRLYHTLSNFDTFQGMGYVEASPRSTMAETHRRLAAGTLALIVKEVDMLQVGDKAPDFTLASDSGANVSLKDFRGQTLVLYFFPKADTPG